ncbi:MAG: IS66 family transposase [Akkermansia sp.]|nr:IS66 family transposase [Akkermansia sp.]
MQLNLPFSTADEVQMLRDSNRYLEIKIEALEEENAMLQRMLFGKKSEKIVREKIEIEEEEPTAVPPQTIPASDTTGKTPSVKKKRRLSATVTKQIEQLVVPEEVMENPLAYERLPESCDKISRRLEFIPAHFELHIFRMPGFVKKGSRSKDKQDAPLYAKAPAGILPGSNMGASIIALALHNKFSLHLPLYRQLKEFERIGLEGLSEGVLCNWVRAASEALEPIWKALHELMLDSGALHIDETPIRCLKSDKTNGYMWAMSSADTGSTLYYWQNSRSADTLNHLLRHGMQKDGRVYEGAILSDGYGGYESWMKHLPEDQKPQWQVCWAHVRRKFVEAAGNSNDPGWSMKMVDLIRPLYVIERELRESKAPPEDKLKERMKKSRPIVEEIFRELTKRSLDTQNPPRNKLKDAIEYALKRREQLSRWLENPSIPIDNNQVERAIRPVTIGRKNSLFIGSPDAGQRAAIIYTMVEECKRTGTDFQQWLTEVLRRLSSHRAAEGYLSLLPGILNLSDSEKMGGKKVTL